MSNRDKAKAATSSRTITEATVPLFGAVKLRSLSESEYQSGIARWFRDEKFEMIPDRQKYDRVKAIQMCLIEDDGTQSFSDSFEDLDTLVNLDAPVIDAIYSAVYPLTRAPAKN